MSELNVIHENFHTNVGCSQRQMNTCHTSFREREAHREKDRQRDTVRESVHA